MRLPNRSKVTWPAKVTEVTVGQLMQTHLGKLRSFLDVLGIQPAAQPSSKYETTQRIVSRICEIVDFDEPEALARVQVAYDLVIRHIDITTTTAGGKASPTSGVVEYFVRGELGSKKKLDFVPPYYFKTLLQLASQRVPIFLFGPTGAGKTFVAEQLAKALDLPYGAQSLSVGVTESMFNGWLIPILAGGAMTYVPAPFVTIYENGGVFLFDEGDNADPNLMSFMNMALGGNQFFLPQRFENQVVRRHKDFVAIMAANTNGLGGDASYVRNQLDAATLNRFRMGTMKIDYDRDVEMQLCDPDVCEWAWGLRERIAEARLQKFMSTRTMIDAQKMKAAYKWGPTEWDARFFEDWSEEDRRVLRA